MRALSSRPFCSCDGRQVSQGDLSAANWYTTVRAPGAELHECGATASADTGAATPADGDPLIPRPFAQALRASWWRGSSLPGGQSIERGGVVGGGSAGGLEGGGGGVPGGE